MIHYSSTLKLYVVRCIFCFSKFDWRTSFSRLYICRIVHYIHTGIFSFEYVLALVHVYGNLIHTDTVLPTSYYKYKTILYILVYQFLIEAFNLVNGGDKKKHKIECIYCDKLLDVEVRYKCLECRASDLCADCLLDHGKHCDIIEEINKSHHVFLVLRNGRPFDKNTFDIDETVCDLCWFSVYNH